MGELSNEDKRLLIYTDERLKELEAERRRLVETRDKLDAAKSLSEAEKRFRIYIAERMPRLEAELKGCAADRQGFVEAAA